MSDCNKTWQEKQWREKLCKPRALYCFWNTGVLAKQTCAGEHEEDGESNKQTWPENRKATLYATHLHFIASWNTGGLAKQTCAGEYEEDWECNKHDEKCNTLCSPPAVCCLLKYSPISVGEKKADPPV